VAAAALPVIDLTTAGTSFMTAPARPTMSATDWLFLVALSVLWGASFFFGKIALLELPPLTVAFLRVGLAGAILVIIARVVGTSLPASVSAWQPFAIMGLLNNALPFSLIFWGQTHIPSGLAAILNATTPLFTVVVAHLATRDEKLTSARVTGVIFGFCGVVVMIGPDMLRQLGADIAAQFACLLAAISYAMAGVYGRRFRGEPPLRVAAGQLIASSVILAPLALVLDRPWTLAWPSASAWAALVALATFSTAIGYVLYFRILARAGATNLLLVTFLIPVSAILLGTLILGEQLATRHIVGMIAILIGLAAIDGRLLRPYRVGTGFSPR
jgi:drug/metabolite transporter (DMT)-like permease